MITYAELKELFEYRDGELYWKIKPSKQIKINSKAGTKRKDGYICVGINKKIYRIHRLIYMMFHGYMPKEIDHIDGNPSNNLIENLRESTHSQNNLNKPLYKNNNSGIKNISWVSKNKKWRLRVTKSNKVVFDSYFEDLELAEIVAIEVRDKYHGEFACHS